MATHKYFDRICALALAVCLFLTLLLYNADALGVQAFSAELGYESRLFSTDRVHTIDIRMEDWEGFLQTAQSEEYSVCTVVIDGETLSNVGIRGKGNTSLSTVSSMNSQRYSLKIEFDQYDSTKSYHGLDKLCLNNLIQDNTMMKDYLTYQMMKAFGAAAPLCSFAYITVNGEDWGLYLAVEAVEESFLRRNYGSDYGELYKPDSMNMGGGRGNGRDFNMENWRDQQNSSENTDASQPFPGNRGNGGQQGGSPSADLDNSATPQMPQMPQGGFGMGQMPQPGNFDASQAPQMPENFDPSALFGQGGNLQMPEGFNPSTVPDKMGGFGGMGSSDVKLQYIDHDPDSYSSIFGSAKTDITKADKTRLIQSLQALSQADSSAVNADAVLRYFVVHNFVVNGDSYTGSMVHNYYLYEQAGQLSMIPWDYNLAFGTFQSNNPSSAVNDDIDAPLSCSGNGDRPMMDWILQSSTYTQLYHQYFADFLDSVDSSAMIDQAAALIAPYVEKDPTKFCTYEDFLTGVAALETFCDLRTQSVRAQLSGDSTPVDTGNLNLENLGTMNMGGGFGKGNRGSQDRQWEIPSSPLPQAPNDGSTQQGAASAPDTGFNRMPAIGNTPFPGQSAGGSTGSQLLLVGTSVGVLLAGLLIAWKYRR